MIGFQMTALCSCRLEMEDMATERPLGHVNSQTCRCHEKLIEMFPIPRGLSGTLHGHVDGAHGFSVGRDAHQLLPIKETHPQVALGVNGSSIRHAIKQRSRVQKQATIDRRPRLFIVIPHKDLLQRAIATVQFRVVRAPQQTIGTTDVVDDLGSRLAVRLQPVNLARLALVCLEQPACPEAAPGVTSTIVHAPPTVLSIWCSQHSQILMQETPLGEAILKCKH